MAAPPQPRRSHSTFPRFVMSSLRLLRPLWPCLLFAACGGGGGGGAQAKPADFVLSNYTAAERKELPFQVDSAADAVESLVSDGLELTQQRFNS